MKHEGSGNRVSCPTPHLKTAAYYGVLAKDVAFGKFRQQPKQSFHI